MAITCPDCGQHFPNSDTINSRHKAKCSGSVSTKPRPCLCGHEATSLTQMKRHRSTCPKWKERDRGDVQMERLAETLSQKHGEGVTHPTHIADAEEKRRGTLKARYGAENVFSRESSIFEQVRAASDAARPVLTGADNPFSRPEVQTKIRGTNLARYGAENPQQSEEVRTRTHQTNVERYGVEHVLSAPKVREKIVTTNQTRYGGPSPAHSPAVVEKARQTNLERWGVEWTSQHPDVRAKQYQTQIETYGSHFFASEEGRAAVKAALMEKYGVEHPSQIDGFWEKSVATFVRRYGATHPLQLLEFLEKRRLTCQERFGVDNPIQSPDMYARLVATVREQYGVDCVFQDEGVKEKGRQTNMENLGVPYAMMDPGVQEKAQQTNIEKFGAPYFITSDVHKQRNIEKYGFPHPMMNREYAAAHLEKMRRPGPNLPERMLHALAPTLLYTGDGSFWRWLPKLKHHKNPDFILPGPDSENPKKGITKVVELFGDFWHSRMFTGKANFDHEQELITAFAEAGIACLVVWESDVKKRRDEVQRRLASFLGCH